MLGPNGDSDRARATTTQGVIRSAQSFFDSTPSGRILNRFSKDLDSIDRGVHEIMGFCLVRVCVCVGG